MNQVQIIQTRQLPEVGDVSSFNIGVDYELNSTDYRFNPKKGNEFRIITSIGTKTIKKNNEIVTLKDPGDPSFDFDKLYDTIKLKSYQFRARAIIAKYFPKDKFQFIMVGKSAEIKKIVEKYGKVTEVQIKDDIKNKN